MASIKPDAESLLERAYDELTEANEPVTARALRGRAKVDMNAVTAWLKARRAAERPPSPVPDDITTAMVQILRDQIVEPIWARCAGLAEAQQKQAYADELLAAHDATASARADGERAEKRADALQAKHDRLSEQLAAAEQALDDARLAQGQLLVDLDRAHADADRARTTAQDAERRASEASAAQLRAETELSTLREVLAVLKTDGSTP